MRFLRLFAATTVMQNEDAQKLAEKIAALVSAESAKTNHYSLQKGIEAIERRLSSLESAISNSKSEISFPPSSHPSQDRFAVTEALVESLFDRNANEKACSFEPNGKPCDHCSMCSSRGF